ncbi:MAG: hypothetical protein HZA17_09235 [Nitrospirae bacterium]|nr:hypothetical protein [Nitrospirota bacterium]
MQAASAGWGKKEVRQQWTIDPFMIPAQEKSRQIKSKKVTATTEMEGFTELMIIWDSGAALQWHWESMRQRTTYRKGSRIATIKRYSAKAQTG